MRRGSWRGIAGKRLRVEIARRPSRVRLDVVGVVGKNWNALLWATLGSHIYAPHMGWSRAVSPTRVVPWVVRPLGARVVRKNMRPYTVFKQQKGALKDKCQMRRGERHNPQRACRRTTTVKHSNRGQGSGGGGSRLPLAIYTLISRTYGASRLRRTRASCSSATTAPACCRRPPLRPVLPRSCHRMAHDRTRRASRCPRVLRSSCACLFPRPPAHVDVRPRLARTL